MFDVLSKINWSPLFISLKTGFVAIIFIFILGVIGAIAVMKMNNRAKWIIDAVFTMPLVLPPTVAGYLLLLVFSLRRPFGIFLKNELGIKVIQSLSGCVIAAVVISATAMLAGNVLGKTRTISVAIASEVAGGNFDIAGIWTCVIVLIAFVIVLAINLITGKGMKNVSRWTK